MLAVDNGGKSRRPEVLGDELTHEVLLELECACLKVSSIDEECTLEATRLLDVGKLENTTALDVLILHIPTDETGTLTDPTADRIILLEEEVILDRTFDEEVDIFVSVVSLDDVGTAVLLVDVCMSDKVKSEPETLDRIMLLEGATLEITILLVETGTEDRIMSALETGRPRICSTS